MLKSFYSKAFERGNKKFFKMYSNPAGERNKQPILETLQEYIDRNNNYTFLEISSGCGLHVSFIAKHFPKVTFQPSEYDVNMFQSINIYSKDHSNICEPIYVDVSQDLNLWNSNFKEKPLKNCNSVFDFILNINMIHITPLNCSTGLFKNSAVLLKPKGILFTYGPYSVNNILTPQSNIIFNESLKRQNPNWGIRDIQDLKQMAEDNSMELYKIHDLPSNNKLLVWRKN